MSVRSSSITMVDCRKIHKSSSTVCQWQILSKQRVAIIASLYEEFCWSSGSPRVSLGVFKLTWIAQLHFTWSQEQNMWSSSVDIPSSSTSHAHPSKAPVCHPPLLALASNKNKGWTRTNSAKCNGIEYSIGMHTHPSSCHSCKKPNGKQRGAVCGGRMHLKTQDSLDIQNLKRITENKRGVAEEGKKVGEEKKVKKHCLQERRRVLIGSRCKSSQQRLHAVFQTLLHPLWHRRRRRSSLFSSSSSCRRSRCWWWWCHLPSQVSQCTCFPLRQYLFSKFSPRLFLAKFPWFFLLQKNKHLSHFLSSSSSSSTLPLLLFRTFISWKRRRRTRTTVVVTSGEWMNS